MEAKDNIPGNLSYFNERGKDPLSGLTVGELLALAAEKFGSAEAVYFRASGERLSFSNVKEESDRVAAGLLQLGFQPGDRVGLWGPNTRRWYITSLALAKAGLISCISAASRWDIGKAVEDSGNGAGPQLDCFYISSGTSPFTYAMVYLNPAFQTLEVSHCMNQVGMKGIVVSGPCKRQNYYELLVQIMPELLEAEAGKLRADKVPMLTTVISMDRSPPGRGCYNYEDIFTIGSTTEALKNLKIISQMTNFDDVCNIQFTSGTTGSPKGVMLTHHNIVNNGFLVGKRFRYSSTDRICIPVPLFHTFGSVVGILTALHYGCSLVFPSPTYDPVVTVKTASEERCTVIYGTPTMHIDLISVPAMPEMDLRSLRKAVTGAASCPIELIKRMKDTYSVKDIDILYGMTETGPIVFQSLPSDSDELRAQTVGYPQEHTEVKLVDKNGRVVRVGVEGELCVRGYMVMRGYWGQEDKTREIIDETRWLHTGDLFVMEPSGHARFVGRIKDIINRGGEKVHPREVEDVLHTIPGVMEAHVFGIPDERLGEDVAAWIRLDEGQSMTAEDVKIACKGQIAHFKIPKYIRFTSDFPKTASGKIQKFRLRELATA